MTGHNNPRPLWRTLRAIALSESHALRAWAAVGRFPVCAPTRWET